MDQAQQQVNDDYQKINQSPNNNELQSKLTQDQSSLNEAQQQLAQHDKQMNDSIYAAFDGKVNIKMAKMLVTDNLSYNLFQTIHKLNQLSRSLMLRKSKKVTKSMSQLIVMVKR